MNRLSGVISKFEIGSRDLRSVTFSPSLFLSLEFSECTLKMNLELPVLDTGLGRHSQ